MIQSSSLVVALVCIISGANGISFEMSKLGPKCLQEDVQKDVLVVGDFSTENGHGIHIDVEITDSKKHRVYYKEDASQGKFAFHSDDYDTYDICFLRRTTSNAATDIPSSVTLNVKIGVEARSYEQLAEAEHLSAMEVELRRLEDLADSVVRDFGMMKKREELHRDTNESTNERMLHFSIFSMVCLLGLAVWQVLYLKQYFKKKKLID